MNKTEELQQQVQGAFQKVETMLKEVDGNMKGKVQELEQAKA